MVQDTINRMIVKAQVTKSTAFTRQEGQGMVEYGLIIALVAVVAAVGLTAVGGNVRDLLSGLNFTAAAPE